MNKPSILLVEDETAIADTILYALRTEGMQIEHCSLGNAALDRLRMQPFDLVVLDVGLPDISGFEVCRNLRTFTDVPVIFLTARHEEVDRIVDTHVKTVRAKLRAVSPTRDPIRTHRGMGYSLEP